ncbi:MAG: MlaD family protein [Chthoniobacterales bacterium]
MKNHEFSNYALALTVVACSAILFGALAFALGGKTFSRVGHEVKANFADVTGVKVGTQVKYAGALSGTVTNIRFLTAQERQASTHPEDAIQLTLSLYTTVPPIPGDSIASIVADTLLSDKFVQLSAGSAGVAPLANNVALQGLTPVTFDQILRNLGPVMGTLDKLSTSFSGDMKSILPSLESFLTQAKTDAADAQVLIKEMTQFLRDTKTPAQNTLVKVEDAAKRLQSLSQSAEAMVKNNEKDLRSSISNLNVTMQNLKVTSTYTKTLSQTLAERPSILIWGNRNLPIPSQQEILKSNRPIPTP